MGALTRAARVAAGARCQVAPVRHGQDAVGRGHAGRSVTSASCGFSMALGTSVDHRSAPLVVSSAYSLPLLPPTSTTPPTTSGADVSVASPAKLHDTV